jgi:hypothetical protein
MSKLPEIIEWHATPGWGAQLGELTIRLHALPTGIVVNRINVFRAADGNLSFGAPLIPIGGHAGRYSGFDFPDAADRARFCADVLRVLLAAYPELREGQP